MTLVVFVLSYCAERPKYRFAEDAARFSRPGTRLIHSQTSVDLASPLSWLWPSTTRWTYATPDPLMHGRFFLFNLIYDEEPFGLMIDVECNDRFVEVYGLDGDEAAPAARNVWGEPLKTPDGQTYRLYDLRADPLSEDAWHQLCETDWAPEIDALSDSSKE